MLHQKAYKFRDQLDYFLGKLSARLPKVQGRLVSEVIYGVAASQTVHLTNIARTLDETIPLHKTVTRLSRNQRDASIGKHVQQMQLNEASHYIKDKTLLVLDGSDIMKPYAKKIEILSSV